MYKQLESFDTGFESFENHDDAPAAINIRDLSQTEESQEQQLVFAWVSSSETTSQEMISLSNEY